MTSTLDIRLLGPPEVMVDGRPAPRLRSRAGIWLLALLILRRDRPTERTWLATTLWPDSREDLALFYLRRTLTELRHSLAAHAGRLLSPTPRTLRFDLAGSNCSCDVVAFDGAVNAGGTADLDRAVTLYRGTLLEGCAEEWVTAERSRREGMFLDAMEKLASLDVARGEHADAVARLRRVLTSDPLRDTAARSLLRLLADAGELSSAIEAFTAFRERLHRDFCSQPDPQTTALYRSIRARARSAGRAAGEMPPSPFAETVRAERPRTHGLPASMTRLIGREEALAELQAALASARLVTLSGPGGVGKTRLAVALSSEVADNYPDGIWFVDLAALADGSPIEDKVAEMLGLRKQAELPLSASISSFIADRAMLLVLDNCEHLISACARLAATLLANCSNLRMLATSRQPLGIPGELVWRVPGLGVPSGLDLSGEDDRALVRQSPAVVLFTDRARAANRHFTLAAGDLDLVADICRRLEGIPLALELAAVRTRAASLQQISERLRASTDILARGISGEPRHQTMRATLDWSYRLLTEPERAVLRYISVFPGGFTLDAVAALSISTLRAPARGPEEASGEVLDILTSLVDRSLVLFAEGPEQESMVGRYRLLAPIRDYAREQLACCGEENATRRLHRDYFLVLAEEQARRQDEAERLDGLDVIAADLDNLRAALAWSLEEDPAAGLRLAIALDWLWRWRSNLGEGCQWVERLLDRCHDLPDTVRADSWVRLGIWSEWQGDYRAAVAWYERALALARAAGDTLSSAGALAGLGTIGCQTGDFRAAVVHLEEGARLYAAGGRAGDSLRIRAVLGSAYHQLGDTQRAQETLEDCLVLARQLGDARNASVALDGLGDIALDQGDLSAAETLYATKLAAARAGNIHDQITHALIDLSNVASLSGDPDAAWNRAEEALGMARDVASPVLQTLCLNHMSRLAYARRELGRLSTLARESVELSWRRREWGRLIPALHRMAALAAATGESNRALRLVAAAARLGSTHGPAQAPAELDFRAEILALASGASSGGMPESEDPHPASLDEIVKDALRWSVSALPEREPDRSGTD